MFYIRKRKRLADRREGKESSKAIRSAIQFYELHFWQTSFWEREIVFFFFFSVLDRQTIKAARERFFSLSHCIKEEKAFRLWNKCLVFVTDKLGGLPVQLMQDHAFILSFSTEFLNLINQRCCLSGPRTLWHISLFQFPSTFRMWGEAGSLSKLTIFPSAHRITRSHLSPPSFSTPLSFSHFLSPSFLFSLSLLRLSPGTKTPLTMFISAAPNKMREKEDHTQCRKHEEVKIAENK